MNLLKSLYVSTYLTAAMLLTGYAGWQIIESATWKTPWLGALIAGAAPTAFFMRVFLISTARTPNRLWGTLLGGTIGTAIAFVLGGGQPAYLAALVGIGGTLLYDYWYSHFGTRSTAILATGKDLPAFSLFDAEGKEHASSALIGQPTVWMFYRGNWCPFCMAQIKEVAAQYRELEARGARVVLVSPQSESHTRSLAKKFDVPMSFLMDVGNQAAKTLDIFAENGLPTGMQALGYDSDVPQPTVFITNAAGTIIYTDLAENYRIRPEPDAFLKVLDDAQASV